MNKILKYVLLAAVVGLLGYKSLYFEKLSTRRTDSEQKFDAVAFSSKLWNGKMVTKMDSAVDLSLFIKEVTANKEEGLKKYSNAMGIGNYRYAFIKTQATVTQVGEDEIQVQVPVADSLLKAVVATEFIYGNAIRDASALVDVKDFPNTKELNDISEEMNRIVRTIVLPHFKKSVKQGDKVNMVAAIEINKEHIKWSGLELLPVRLQIAQ